MRTSIFMSSTLFNLPSTPSHPKWTRTQPVKIKYSWSPTATQVKSADKPQTRRTCTVYKQRSSEAVHVCANRGAAFWYAHFSAFIFSCLHLSFFILMSASEGTGGARESNWKIPKLWQGKLFNWYTASVWESSHDQQLRGRDGECRLFN